MISFSGRDRPTSASVRAYSQSLLPVQITLVPRSPLPVWFGMLLLGGLVFLSGCTSTRPPEERRAQQAQALGTWRYQVTGSPVLDQGSISIERNGERLFATLRDTRRGPLRARVTVREDWMELQLDRIVVSGRLKDDRYRATVELSTWDVRGGQSDVLSPQVRSRARGTLVAERRRTTRGDTRPSERCAPLLRESSYVCPPLTP